MKFQKMDSAQKLHPQLFVWLGIISAGTLALLPAKLLAAPVLQEAATDASTGVWPVLLPLSTAAIGVERATEIIWNAMWSGRCSTSAAPKAGRAEIAAVHPV
ncbi:MAG: hypothetical protein R2911_36345 [Caldilineaceae bacterium]